MPVRPEFQARLESIEDLLAKLESAADPHLRSTAEELVQLVMDLHGSGLHRILEILADAGDAGESVVRTLVRDDLVSSLLVLHGLHPQSLEQRLTSALEKIRPSLKKRGGDVELLHVVEGAVKLKLQANGHAASLKELVEGAVYQAAPDINSLEIESPEERRGFVPLAMLQASPAVNGKGR